MLAPVKSPSVRSLIMSCSLYSHLQFWLYISSACSQNWFSSRSNRFVLTLTVFSLSSKTANQGWKCKLWLISSQQICFDSSANWNVSIFKPSWKMLHNWASLSVRSSGKDSNCKWTAQFIYHSYWEPKLLSYSYFYIVLISWIYQ